MIVNLNTEAGWSPQQALIAANERVEDMDTVVIVYFRKDTNGEACLLHSETDCRDLLFLSKAIECYTFKE